jgi:hypothetical protein
MFNHRYEIHTAGRDEPVDLLERSGIHQHAVVDVLVVLGDAELETPREEVRVLRDTDVLTELRVGEVHDGLRRLETAIAALHDGPFASTRARLARDHEPTATVQPVYEERPDTGGALFPLEMPSGLHDVGVNRDRDSQRHQHAHQRCQYFPRSSHESPPVGGQRVLASGV